MEQYSFSDILWKDHLTKRLAIALPIEIGIGLLVYFFESEIFYMSIILFIAALVMAIVIYKRVNNILLVLEEPLYVTATVIRVFRSRNGKYLTVEYFIDSQQYRNRITVGVFDPLGKVKKGDEIELITSRTTPNVPLIRQKYK